MSSFMMTECSEFEKVQIGNCQIRLPSSICTDRNTFQNIFSLETWNQVLDPEQQDRILKMLPSEILAIPGAAEQTIEDLLSGNLIRFGSSPLETFFSELNIGGFDPEVVKMKTGIKKQWRRDLLRRRKMYHTKLLQEVIVSTDAHLKHITEKRVLEVSAPNSKNSKPVKPAKTSNQSASKPKKASKSGAAKASPLRQRVAKRLHDEIAAINQAFNYSLSSSDEELPVTKKSFQTPKTTSTTKNDSKAPKKVSTKAGSKVTKGTPTTSAKVVSSAASVMPMPMLTPVRSTVAEDMETIVSNASSSNLIRSIPGSMVLKTKEEQAAMQMAKFPKIAPSPFTLTSTSSRTSTVTSASTSSICSLNHKSKQSQTKVEVPVPTSLVQIQMHSSNPIKSSPILASQLQAPVVSSLPGRSSLMDNTSRPRPNLVVHQDINKIRTGISDFPSQVMKLCLKSDDEMESSSEDEFEAIEPTIGFSTNFSMLPTVSKIQQSKSTPKTSTSRSSTQGVNHKILPAKPKQVLYTVPKSSGSPSSSSTTTTVNKSFQNVHQLGVVSNSKNPNSHILLTSPSMHKNSSVNSSPSLKVISSPSEPYSLVPVAHSTPVSSTSVTSTAKLTTNLILTPNSQMTSATLVPISVQHGGFSKIQSSRQTGVSFPVTSNPTTISNGPSPPSSISNNSLNNIVSTVSSSTTTPNNILPPKSSTSILANTCVAMPHTHIVPTLNNSIRSSTHLPPMTLTDLSLSLGLDVGGDSKLGLDKMDDLSVLDGNPFDSIPNLSDELDGFDLDLVDGLCDFEVLLSEEKQYVSFFSLIREVLCSTQYHRMTLLCLEKTIRKWAVTPTATLNAWFMRVNDWNEVLMTALNFLAGNYQDVHPEDFVPYIEYKYKTKYYQWIGAGRDSDTNLLQLCNMWLENLDRLPPLKKQDGENEEHEEEDEDNEDSDDHAEEVKKKYMRPKTPPPPRFVTDWTVRASTTEEKSEFQEQERFRFDNPHKAFTYRMHSYESVVGPVKGVYSSQSGVTNKARGHSLLVDDRPPYVTILALVRDSVARLPNGEGTRSEICEMLRDSAFLAPEASNVTLNSVVSGALDRLHYERDPCVRYDSHKKNWIYLHRDRSQEQFERLHHNRSYTKSTKSRNNSSRKSRKKAASQSSASGQQSSTNTGTQTNSGTESSSAVPSSSSSVASTPASTPNLTVKFTSSTTTPTSAPNLISCPNTSAQAGSDSAQSSDTLREIPATVTLNSSSEVQLPTAPFASAPTIKFTIPVSSGVTKTWSQTADATKSPTFLQIQHLPNSSQVATPPTAQNNTTHLIGSLRQPIASATNVINMVANPVSVSSSSAPQSIPFPSGQFIFGSNALLRLSSNLRLPEGVRFTQLRLPMQQTSAGQLPGSSMKISQPQHRILLTRGAFSGHPQTQGVLLGQTSTGQTVILSTTTPIGNLQPSSAGTQLNPITIQSTQNQQHSAFETKPVVQYTQNAVSTSSVLALLNSSVTTSRTSVSVPNSITTVSPQIQSQLVKRIAITSNGSQAPILINSTGVASASLGTLKTNSPAGSNSSTVQNSVTQGQPLHQVQHLAQNVVSVAQVQAQIQQQSSSGTGPAPQLTSPFIIRSNQGDFVIPGHISLGRGMQGIKVIPVPTGKQTVLARLVNPGAGQTQIPTLHNQATQQ